MTFSLWERQFGKWHREQTRAAFTRLPAPQAFRHRSEAEAGMDNFTIRSYIPFPELPFADTDVKSARVVVEYPAGSGAIVLDESKDFPVNGDGTDWDLSHPDVVLIPVDPAQPDGEKKAWLKTTNTFVGEQGQQFTGTTSYLDDADPPNSASAPPHTATIQDTVPPEAPNSAMFKEEAEINNPTP